MSFLWLCMCTFYTHWKFCWVKTWWVHVCVWMNITEGFCHEASFWGCGDSWERVSEAFLINLPFSLQGSPVRLHSFICLPSLTHSDTDMNRLRLHRNTDIGCYCILPVSYIVIIYKSVVWLQTISQTNVSRIHWMLPNGILNEYSHVPHQIGTLVFNGCFFILLVEIVIYLYFLPSKMLYQIGIISTGLALSKLCVNCLSYCCTGDLEENINGKFCTDIVLIKPKTQSTHTRRKEYISKVKLG